MTLVEGIGDEVIQFLGVVVVILVGALAWTSTNARPDRYRTVLVMRSRSHQPVTLRLRTRPSVVVTSSSTTGTVQATVTANTGTTRAPAPSNVIPLQEMDSIVDADMAMMDHNRLHFYRRMDESSGEESDSQELVESTSSPQIREMDNIVNAMEADGTTDCDFFARPNESNSQPIKPDSITVNNSEIQSKPEENENVDNASGDQGTSSDDTSKILIKLIYLNDTLKEVEGCLDELLKDFKLRHFSAELSSQSRVRLIFRGRVLSDEAATLRALGLHHRAVLHCLVHPTRNTQAGGGVGAGMQAVDPLTTELVAEGAPPERVWDLENILMTMVSLVLTIIWFFRCEYSNMFTASASVALFGLTVFYSVAILGLYLNDTFHFDRRPAQVQVQAQQPVPDN